MKAILIATALMAAVALGACGGDDDDDGGSATAASPAGATVRMDGGTLVDADGAALYTSDQEMDGTVRCVDGCAEDWLPLTAAKPSAGSDVSGKLATVKRPDGAQQVTLDGKPLYRFAEDPPGEVTGDGFKDDFGGREFTWSVVGSAQPSSGDSGNTSGSDYSY
jgi:predicted lipoprotein with Yx(FWY)xxD motif